MANLSTLATQTCFRTADGEFHGFEGTNDKSGCCYRQLHARLELRNRHRASLPVALAVAAQRRLRLHRSTTTARSTSAQMLPDGKARSGIAAADGQMGQIIKVYLDWQLSATTRGSKAFWPKAQKALEFSWVEGGWDADRDGVHRGRPAQHLRRRVLRAESAVRHLLPRRAARRRGDGARGRRRRVRAPSADACSSAAARGSTRTSSTASTTSRRCRACRKDRSPTSSLHHGLGRLGDPEYQVGEGCLADQLDRPVPRRGRRPRHRASTRPTSARRSSPSTVQLQARPRRARRRAAHLTPSTTKRRSCLRLRQGRPAGDSISLLRRGRDRLRVRRRLADALCGHGRRGHRVLANIAARYDGERRNPWDEPECGHHYARAMAAWTSLIALSGFDYLGPAATSPSNLSAPEHGSSASGPPPPVGAHSALTPRTFRLDVLFGSLEILELSLPNNRKKTYSDRIRLTESNPLVLA